MQLEIPPFLSQAFNTILTQIKPAIIYLKHNPTARYVAITGILIIIGIMCLDTKVKKSKRQKANPESKVKSKSATAHVLTKSDFTAISGDDVVTTQLDLAKAYTEMDQKELAKKLLKQILKDGNDVQKQAAKKLLKNL